MLYVFAMLIKELFTEVEHETFESTGAHYKL